MHNLIVEVENRYKKPKVVNVQSGDTVRVHQKIKEGSKERTQVFEGLVIKTRNKNTVASAVTVRRIASGVGVEKTYKLHSPLIEKIEVVKRSKVRRKYLSYMRKRSGKSARLASVDFNKTDVNDVSVPMDETKEAKQAMEHLEDEKTEKPEATVEKAEESPKPEPAKETNNSESEKPAPEKTEKPDSEKSDKADKKSEDDQTQLSKEDKAAAKKAKADEFRKQQESK